MKRETRDRWVEALRSGQYEQGQGALRSEDDDGDSWCCLGVLLNVIDPQGWVYDGGDWFHRLGDRSEQTIAPAFWDELGTGVRQAELFQRNDGLTSVISERSIHQHTFEEIANWIAENIHTEEAP